MSRETKDILRAGRPTIGIDLDDVIFNFNDSLHAYHNAKYGTRVTRADVTTYAIEEVWKCTPEEASAKVFEFCLAPEHASTAPLPGSVEALAWLSGEYDLHIITSRGDQVKEVTMKWIEEHFPAHFSSVRLTNQYFGVKEKIQKKIDACRELGVRLMVEDSLSQATEIAGAGIPVLLLDAPWNQGELPEGITRVFTWGEIREAISSRLPPAVPDIAAPADIFS